MFDCVIVDFENKQSSKKNLQKIFPYATVIPFVDSYHLMIKKLKESIRTEYFWFLSTKVNYDKFDFNFLPEQHESKQIHTWSNNTQAEGDTFLIPKNFPDNLKFLRDYKDINYHYYNGEYDFDFEYQNYDLSNAIENLTKNSNKYRYLKYYESNTEETFYPSYWEDIKVYKSENTFYIPGKASEYIKTQIYDYPFIETISYTKTNDCFDIIFISNGEPFEDKNYNLLKDHCKKHNLKNKLHWVKNVDGRTKAYKVAANKSSTEYFYAVFAKSMVNDDFKFDFTVGRGQTKKHRIFYSYLKEVDLSYGTFNINLYNKSLCINTPDSDILDFTLSQSHEVIPIVASTSLLAPDNYTAWKNAFREVSKLVLWQKKKPTVETKHRLSNWLKVENKWLLKGAMDGKKFTEDCNYDLEKILQTYTWDFCRSKFKSLYPSENFY